MKHPLGQGSSTWARTTHFADLEWGMTRKKVLALFTGTRVYPKYEGRNPRTGEPVIVRETVALPSAATPVPGLPVFASVMFDDDGHLDEIQLKSSYPRPAETTDEALLQAANKVAAALDLETLTELPDKPKSWKHKGTQIVLDHDDDCFWFDLTPVTTGH